jgi:M6 family metalloprotease-like protein
MKPTKTFRSVLFLLVSAGCLGLASAAPYGPEGHQTSWVQPSGETLELRVYGDEYYGRTETIDGYTVVYNEQDGAYHFASLAADGSGLVPSGTKVTAGVVPPQPKHLDLPKEKVREIAKANFSKLSAKRLERWNKRVRAVQGIRAAMDPDLAPPRTEVAAMKAQAAPILGNKKGLTILAQFPNDPQTPASDAVNFPTNRAKIDRLCNSVGYREDGNTGSVRDYFFDQSIGRLTYTQTVTQVITLPKPRNYYNFADYPTNRVFRGDAGRVLLIDALDVLKKLNFNFSGLSMDSNRRILATNLFFAGPDSGVWAQGLWPHQWSLASDVNVGSAMNPIYVSAYQMTNLSNSSPTIGTFCHENGHLLLDYPDLYDYGGESSGVGSHCLMGSGNHLDNGRTPGPINAHFKDLIGWGQVVDLQPESFGTFPLSTTGNIAYRIRKPGQPSEHFIVENRGAGDKWAAYSVSKGIAIWHVDENVSGTEHEQMTNELHYGVSLEQADGRFDLEAGRGRGDSGDLFKQGGIFSETTTPNSKWWDGSSSSVKVEVLGSPGESTEVTFGAVPANTIIVGSPNGGEVIYPSSNYRITWKANITGNVKIELFQNDVFRSLLAANVPNNGSFRWSVAPGLLAGSGYSLKISSLTNPVATSDSSDETFSVSDATFPVGGQLPYGWFKPKGSSRTWAVKSDLAFEGKHSVVSQPLGDGKTAGIAYRANFEAGNISFYMKVSSERGFDHARFFINGVAQVLPSAGGARALSGNVDWTFMSFPVPAGTHTFMWTYQKDDSYGDLRDRVWIDGVSMPPTTQEIAVENSEGVDLEDGKATLVFEPTLIRSSSAPQVITIWNRGTSTLSGLKITRHGPAAADLIVSPLAKTALEPGTSTSFNVVFSPKSAGLKTAGIRIHSNDQDEPEFAIAFEAEALGRPTITVKYPSTVLLRDGKSRVEFGSAPSTTMGNTRTFTVTNTGSAPLSDMSISIRGKAPSDFRISSADLTSLNPGESAVFHVTFAPTRKGVRSAAIAIHSNDTEVGPFDIILRGTGGDRPKTKTLVGPTGDLVQPPTTRVEVIEGQKYLTLSVYKQVGVDVGTVEVSSNLLDWFSGNQHTTTMLDDDTVLKVRDNTPILPDAKRYIRVR